MPEYVIGVDFGTSTSLVAEGRISRDPSTLPVGESTTWMPSIAASIDGTFVAGEDAERRAPQDVIRSIKRAITENRSFAEHGLDDSAVDDVIASILTELRGRAVELGLELQNGSVRLGCPAMWTGSQRSRLIRLAKRSGIAVQTGTLIDEPIAAGVAWVMRRTRNLRAHTEGNVLVYDMGGGTLDVAVLNVVGGPGDEPEISVLAADGNDKAGDRFDEAIRDHYFATHGIEVGSLPRPGVAAAYALRAAREAKLDLTGAHHASVPVAYTDVRLPDLEIERSEFESLVKPILAESAQKVYETIRASLLTETLDDSNRQYSPMELRAMGDETLHRSIKYVLLAGGMSRTPIVQQHLQELFPGAQIHTIADVQPDEAIAIGLAETETYERLSLHRPGFDFIVEWDTPAGTREHVLYSAYTPFYTRAQVFNTNTAKYSFHDHGRLLPTQGQGWLSVRSLDGERVKFAFDDGAEQEGIPLNFGPRFSFQLSQNGQILILDGSSDRELKLDRWPVLRGRGYSDFLQVQKAKGSFSTWRTPWWWQ